MNVLPVSRQEEHVETRKENETTGLKAEMGLISALSIVVGMVLGAGAFMKPAAVMAAAGNSTTALCAWLIGAVLSMAGGLTLCELGVMFPRTGGVYVYLEEIYGRKTSYLYGWMITVIFGPATIGALGGYFSSVFCLLFNLPGHYAPAVGFAVMAFVLFVNSVGVKQAGYLQVVATFCKLVPIALLTIFGIWKGNGAVLNMSTGASVVGPFSVAIIATLFAYDGWAQVASVAGEIKNPGKILPRAIIGGLAFLSVLYLVINVSMIMVLSPAEMVALGHDASSIAAQRLFGLYGGNIISVGIMISILGGLNGYVMAISRVVLTMSERRQLPGSTALGKIEEDSKTPVNAAVMIVLLSFIYLQLFNADRLTDLAMLSVWVFYLLSFIAVIIARKRMPEAARSYRVPLYPLTPLIAIGGALYIIYGMAAGKPLDALLSMGLTLLGLPVLAMLDARAGLLTGVRVSKKYLVLSGALVVTVLLLFAVRIIDTRPILRIAVESSTPPLAFENREGKLSGMDVEIMQALGREMDHQVSFRPTSFNHLFLSLEKELTDVAVSGISVTDERKRIVGFSDSYHESPLALLLPPGNTAHSVEDLKGRTVGVKSGSTGETYLIRFPGSTVRKLEVASDLAAMFAAGQLDAVVYDRTMIDRWLTGGQVTGRVIDLDQQERYAVAFRKNDAEMAKRINKALDTMRKSGELERIKQKWLKSE